MTRPEERKTRLLYLLPRYDAASPEHVYHLYGFLVKLKQRLNVSIVVERVTGVIPSELPARRLLACFPLFRFLEELFIFIGARLGGTRVFYIHYSYTGAIAASLVTRVLGGEAYYWNCSMYRMFQPDPQAGWRERLRYRWNTFLLETCVQWCSHLVTGTPRMAAYYASHAGIRLETIRVLPNFVDLPRFQEVGREEARSRLGLDPTRKIVLFLHRMAPRKGAHFLPEILRELVRADPLLMLVAAGGGPYLPELRRRMAQEGLSNRVDFRDWVSNRDVPLYFHAADLYIMPSVEEGFPRVLLESMAAGCPFVAFDVGGVRDVIQTSQSECLAPALDIAAFQEYCARALGDPSLLAVWREAGLRQVGLFSEERVLEAFLQMAHGRIIDGKQFGFPDGLSGKR